MLGVLSPLALCWDVGMEASRSSAQGWGRLSVGAPYKYRREPKSIKIYKGRRR